MRAVRARYIKKKIKALLGDAVTPGEIRREKREYARAGLIESQQPKLKVSRRKQRFADKETVKP